MTENSAITSSDNQNNSEGYDIQVILSADYYQAFITVHTFGADIRINSKVIQDALAKKNVSYGLIQSAFDKIIDNPFIVENLLVAQGVPHVNGIDGEVSYLFDTEMKAHPTLNVDGTVDFKNMNFLQTVYKGDLIATRTMPTEGTAGVTVTGKTIRPKPGKIKNFKVGKGVVVSENGLEVIADVTGSIQFDGEKVAVIQMLEIKDDVGVKTGNIEFSGKIIVTGNITTGYSVISDDDIVINGIVEGAIIKTKGNLIINGGVQGNNQAEISVGGKLIAKFLNNATVLCHNNIEADAIMHSTVICDGSITVKGKKALIVGGDISVRYDIEAKVIGSEMGTMTKIKLGLDSKVMESYQETLEEIKTLKETITKLSQVSRLLSKQYEQTRNPEVKANLDKTETSRSDYARQMAEAAQRLKEVTELIETLKGSKVKGEEIYPGVKLKIGNTFYNVKETLYRVTLKKDEGDIRVFTY